MEIAPAPAQNTQGAFATNPQGVVLHGTRSGQAWRREDEFRSTVNYLLSGANGLAWHATIGDDAVAEHLDPAVWGWHARAESRTWIGVEFAQATVAEPITDAQVRAFGWYFRHRLRQAWPDLPAHFIGHSELASGITDGKSDPFPIGSREMDELRKRIIIEVGG